MTLASTRENTVRRRLQRRMQALQLDAVDSYIARLRQEPTEIEFLFKDLLIGVTHFFRDPEAFAALDRMVLPQLFAGKGATDQVRVCVAGCASGEEAYSLAILLHEHMDRLASVPHVQVFATDIDAQALEAARRGIYPEGIAEHVSARAPGALLRQAGSHVPGKPSCVASCASSRCTASSRTRRSPAWTFSPAAMY